MSVVGEYNVENDVIGGLVEGYRVVNKFGRALSVTTSEVVVSQIKGSEPVAPTAASVVNIVSSSAADAAAGTGCRTALIEGLDGTGVEVSELVTMNGVTPVATVQTFRRVFRVSCKTSGTGLRNAGAITFEFDTGSVPAGSVAIGRGRTQLGHYTVPLGFFAVLRDVTTYVKSSGAIQTRLYERGTWDGVSRCRELLGDVGENNRWAPYDASTRIEELTDVWATAETSSGTTNVSVSFKLFLYPNT